MLVVFAKHIKLKTKIKYCDEMFDFEQVTSVINQ